MDVDVDLTWIQDSNCELKEIQVMTKISNNFLNPKILIPKLEMLHVSRN